jgi:hypothetical protein
VAQMIPEDGPAAATQSDGERAVYSGLKRHLGDDYTVIHSQSWTVPDNSGHMHEGEADFIVIHPGMGILILEVKGGTPSYEGRTRRWYSTNAKGQKFLLKRSPFDQAQRAVHTLRDFLDTGGTTGPYREQYYIGYAVWFPDVDEWDMPRELNMPPELILDKNAIDQPGLAFRKIYAHWGRKQDGPEMTPQALKALVDRFVPDIELHSSIRHTIQTEAKHYARLSREQLARLQDMQMYPRLAIPGAAGTGKTVLAFEQAWRLANNGLKVLLLCPDKVLADWMRLVVRRDPRQRKPAFDIYDVKALVLALAEQSGMPLEAIKGLRMNSSDHQHRLCAYLEAYSRKLDKQKQPMPYDAILVDQAEDINTELWVPLQRLLRDRANGKFCIFYDEAQRTVPGSWQYKLGGKITQFPLMENRRNTQCIFDAMKLYNPALENMKCLGSYGRSIEFFPSDDAKYGAHAPTADGEIMTLVRVLDHLSHEFRFQPADILVMTCRSVQQSRWNSQRVLGTYRLRWLMDGIQEGEVPLSSIRSAKGLEAKAVVLTELDGVQRDSRRDTLLYVAISRAMHHVCVVGAERDIQQSHPSLWDAVTQMTRRR